MPDDRNIDTKILKNELKNSPMFNFSLGSKELFHSNFLAWLGHKCKERNKKDSAYKQKVNECGKNEIKKISKYHWLDVDFLKNNNVLKQNKYPVNNGDYNSYLGSTVLFIYQYYKLNDSATVDEVLKYVINEIQEIQKIF